MLITQSDSVTVRRMFWLDLVSVGRVRAVELRRIGVGAEVSSDVGG